MSNPTFLDTILLLALPASGKSEVRRYLMNEKREKRVEHFHFEDTVQLDDYPYVEFFRETDDALLELGEKARFFEGAEGRFVVGEDWGTLLQLVNDDYAVMANPEAPTPPADAELLFTRIDAARAKVGAPAAFAELTPAVRAALAEKMARKAAWVHKELFGKRPATIADKTLVIEFARGGGEGAAMPLNAPHGYQWNLSQLDERILAKAAILYIWVEPEESRRKNLARAIPGLDTVIFHAAPEAVMRADYGCDDIAYLMSVAKVPDTIPITKNGKVYNLPIARFDNREDKTTFVRDEPASWNPILREKLHAGLTETLDRLWKSYLATR